jgi:uncharacterized protein (DUF58 family)
MTRFMLAVLVLVLGVLMLPTPALAAHGRVVRGVGRVVTAPVRLCRLIRQRCIARRCHYQPVEVQFYR